MTGSLGDASPRTWTPLGRSEWYVGIGGYLGGRGSGETKATRNARFRGGYVFQTFDRRRCCSPAWRERSHPVPPSPAWRWATDVPGGPSHLCRAGGFQNVDRGRRRPAPAINAGNLHCAAPPERAMSAVSGRPSAKNLERILSALGPAYFAEMLGIERASSGTCRCPFHDDNRPSASLTIGPNETLRLHCFACGRSWDAHAVCARILGISSFPAVLDAEAELLSVGAVAPGRTAPSENSPAGEKPWPNPDELLHLWRRSAHHDGELRAVERLFKAKHWCSGAIATYDLVRLLPPAGPFPPWWPDRWVAKWRVAALLYDAWGTVRTLQARAIVSAEPKDRFPLGRRATGVFFADQLGRALLRGDLRDTDGLEVVVAEGLTSWVRACCFCATTRRAAAVLGIGSFSMTGLGSVRWPELAEYVIAVDSDSVGDRYADRILQVLPRTSTVRRVRWRR